MVPGLGAGRRLLPQLPYSVGGCRWCSVAACQRALCLVLALARATHYRPRCCVPCALPVYSQLDATLKAVFFQSETACASLLVPWPGCNVQPLAAGWLNCRVSAHSAVTLESHTRREFAAPPGWHRPPQTGRCLAWRWRHVPRARSCLGAHAGLAQLLLAALHGTAAQAADWHGTSC